MPITEKQKELRRTHLGSSDMAAILGVDPWRNAYDVWLEKTGKAEGVKETEVMEAGSMFEDGILRWAEDKKLGKLIRNQYRAATGFPIGSNIDALVVASGEPVEAKTSGLFGPLAEQWGEDGTDAVPDRTIIQCHVHMLCAEREICHIPAFLGGRGFALFHIDQDDEIMDIIRDKSLDFWENHVEADSPPPDIMPSLEMAKRMKREPEKVVEIETQIVQNWLNAKDNLKNAEDIKKAAEAEMLAALGDAEGGQCALGLLTYFLQSRRSISVTELKASQPELYKEIEGKKLINISTYRVPRLKKPKPPKGELRHG